MDANLNQLNAEATRAAQRYMGKLAWPTIALGLAVPAGAVATLVLWAGGTLGFVPAVVLLGALTYMSYTPVHEAAHGNISGNHKHLSWLNDVIGTLNSTFILLPYAGHRTEHLIHHRFTNDAERDPDAMLAGSASNPLRFVGTCVRFLIQASSYPFRDGRWPSVPLGTRVRFLGEIAVMAGWRVAFLAMVPLWEGLALFVLSYLFALTFLVYWFAYRPHHPFDETARYRNTANFETPGVLKPLRWFWLGQDIHGMHHLFPRVPFYHYRRLQRDIAPVLAAHQVPHLGLLTHAPLSAQS